MGKQGYLAPQTYPRPIRPADAPPDQIDAASVQMPDTAPAPVPLAPPPAGTNSGALPAGVNAPSASSPTAAAPVTTAAGVTSTPATVGQTTAQGAPTTVAQSFQQALVNRLNPGTISANDPSIAPAIQANRMAEQRTLARQRNTLAEQAARGGTSMSGGTDAQMLAQIADSNARSGAYEGNLLQALSQLQNQNQTGAMGLANGMLGQQSQLDLQRELGMTDADIRRAALAQQGQLGQGDLSLRRDLGQGQLNLGLLSELLHNNQFGQQLGQQNSQYYAGLDQSGLLGLLGMLG